MNAQRTFETEGANWLPAYPSPDEIERHLDRARRLRAEATAEALAAAARGIARPLGRLLAPLARWRDQRRTHHALMRLSDRALADIGIAREHIALVARGVDAGQHEAGGTGWRRWWQAAEMRLEAVLRAQQQRRRVHRELMAHSDRELDDLGVRRVDIWTIARGRLPAGA